MDGFAQGILDDVKKVTKKWAEQSRREIRDANARSARRSAFIRARQITVQDAAWEIMEQAYLKASGGGKLPVKPRQIMYAARGHIQQRTGKKLDDRYFCQTILPDYVAANPELTASWDIVWDARGNLIEPHTNRQVPLGTLEVRDYLAGGESRYLVRESHGGWATCGPDDRFGAVLFVEKEGFMPLFRAVKLAERYDLAIMSTKGLSTTAARQLVDHFVGTKKVPVFCIRDFDLDGFKIAGTLRAGTRRYSWRSRGAIDLGLRGEDIEKWELERGGGVLSREPAGACSRTKRRSGGRSSQPSEATAPPRPRSRPFSRTASSSTRSRPISSSSGSRASLRSTGSRRSSRDDEVLLQAARGFARDAIAARHLEALSGSDRSRGGWAQARRLSRRRCRCPRRQEQAALGRCAEGARAGAAGGGRDERTYKERRLRQHQFIKLKSRARGGAADMSPIDAAGLAAALGGRRSGKGWLCRCPLHDDRSPSFWIKDGPDGRPRFRCLAGCDWHELRAELVRRGLLPGQGTPARPGRGCPSRSGARAQAA